MRGQGRARAARHPAPSPPHTCIQPLPDRYLLSSSSGFPCWVLGTLGTIREGRKGGRILQAEAQPDEGHKAAPCSAQERLNEASMAGTPQRGEGGSKRVGSGD